MARSKDDFKPKRSRKAGKKTAKRIKKNHEILNSLK